MSLESWQNGLANLVLHGTIENELFLSDEDKLWLEKVKTSPGFRVTCDIQIWWRSMRIRTAAPLTIRALENQFKKERTDSFINEFINENLIFSQYYITEALSFIKWLNLKFTGTNNDTLTSITQFEEALLICKITPNIYSNKRELPNKLVCGPTLRVIKFYTDPELYLNALLSQTSFPIANGHTYYIIVAHGISHYWRRAIESEVDLIEVCQKPQLTSEISRKFGKNVDHLFSEEVLVDAKKEVRVN
jgi:hypothetical protein